MVGKNVRTSVAAVGLVTAMAAVATVAWAKYSYSGDLDKCYVRFVSNDVWEFHSLHSAYAHRDASDSATAFTTSFVFSNGYDTTVAAAKSGTGTWAAGQYGDLVYPVGAPGGYYELTGSSNAPCGTQHTAFFKTVVNGQTQAFKQVPFGNGCGD